MNDAHENILQISARNVAQKIQSYADTLQVSFISSQVVDAIVIAEVGVILMGNCWSRFAKCVLDCFEVVRGPRAACPTNFLANGNGRGTSVGSNHNSENAAHVRSYCV